ncbi:hypothetical protein F0L74_26985 [Chitinophaga agrisoli]|uniref:Uncharacterized protein n=1 Tax=Chitinophaga agrisoli TaxID=2607653 RepID=A0A5B2VLU9_9BACT|nr:hypothetical protein [Chitinophaga agrisoli]KAA2239834.1 hypothetical protein F0L74_26985 [Chitinophaga agrisoli]
MQPYIITLLTILTFSCYAQTGEVKTFKKKTYINGNLYQQTSGAIKIENEPIDVYFFQRHFSSPAHLPKKFTDKQYSGQTISFWSNPNGKKDFQSNWTNTYSYDSLGRVINYAYSACVACSSVPYNYSVTYNAKGQVTLIADKSKDRFRFYYNDKGDIIKFEKYLLDKLETEITFVEG